MSTTYLIATDGLCKNNQAKGGQKGTWAFVVFRNHDQAMLGGKQGSDPETTNNRMEMQALIEALTWLQKTAQSTAKILSDSSLVVQGMNDWRAGWKRRGWKKSNGDTVENLDLWVKLDELATSLGNRVIIEKVKGHGSGATLESRLNNAADAACNEEYINKFI